MRDSLLVGHLSTLHGDAAIDFVLEREDNQALQDKLTNAFQNWAMGTPDAAIERFLNMPENHAIWREIEQLGRAAMMSAIMNKNDVAEFLTHQENIPAGEARNDFLLGGANVASSNDLEAAKQIIAEIHESKQRVEALGMFAELAMRKDPVGLSKWLTTLEPSPSRDVAVTRFANLLIQSDPERAREWAETIEDERTREKLLKKIER